MPRPDKAASVAALTDEFRSSAAVLLTEYRGLTVSQMKQLRRSLGESASYAVVKNTLTRIAAKDAGIEGLDDLLVGPSAVAFVKGDPVEAAKGLRTFAKDHPLLVIKGGVLDGKPLSAAEIAQLAELESREVLLAKLAGAMKGSLQNAVSLFAAPLSQAARTIDALRAKAEADPSVLAGGAGAPAAAPEAADEPVAAEDVASTTDEAAPADSDNQTPAEDSATPEATADGTTEG
jgi:large subunit ribosomal protein L10